MQTTIETVDRARRRTEAPIFLAGTAHEGTLGVPDRGNPLGRPAEHPARDPRQDAAETALFQDLLSLAQGLGDLLELWPALSPAEAAELVPRLSELAGRLVREIQVQRDLTDAERGEIVVQRVPLDAGQVAADVVRGYECHPLGEGRRLELRVPGEPRILLSDRLLLRRVLASLVDNALEAGGPGDTVVLAVEDAGDAAVFHVANAGVMPEAVQAQVFQRSFSTRGPRHRGLGTYRARLLTERYLGGSLRFASEAGRGTVFSVRLPLG